MSGFPNAWAGTIGVEGEATVDGRRVAAGGFRWEPWEALPLYRDALGLIAGTIDAISRPEPGVIHGSGRTSLPPGEYTGGIDARATVDVGGRGPDILIVEAQIHGFTVHRAGSRARPAWPQVKITVTEGASMTETLTYEELRDAIDGLHAYDIGATDSGIHDEDLRARVIGEVGGMTADWSRQTLSRVLYDLCLSDAALDQGHGWEDALDLARWFDNGFQAAPRNL